MRDLTPIELRYVSRDILADRVAKLQVKAADVDRLRPEVIEHRAAAEMIRVLHTDSVAGYCPTCFRAADVSDTDDGLVAWPCPTLQALGHMPHTFNHETKES